MTVVHRNGWHDIDGARAFALPGKVINAVGKERVVLAKAAVGPYRQCGTLQDWTATVGALAAGHRLLRFSIATALAGALLDLGGFESGCFHFFGKSSEGKTTCLRMAASVWGSGADGGYVRTWRTIANGLEAAFAGTSDTCLPLDELGQVERRELGHALYMATGDIGKQRMRRDATLKPSHSWRVMVLASGEFPIDGARAHAGQWSGQSIFRCAGSTEYSTPLSLMMLSRAPSLKNARQPRRQTTERRAPNLSAS
ncbi:MAG TPA: DUF927 domain-containing protein [Roseiarcus sp.]